MKMKKYFTKFLNENELDYPIYKKINWNGLTIEIENPAGSIRKGVDYNGKQWETKMKCDYGRIKKTKGKDGDMVDVFVGSNLKTNDDIYRILQRNPYTNLYDEDKYMLGFDSIEQAKKKYQDHYDNPDYLMGIYKIKSDVFKNIIDSDIIDGGTLQESQLIETFKKFFCD